MPKVVVYVREGDARLLVAAGKVPAVYVRGLVEAHMAKFVRGQG